MSNPIIVSDEEVDVCTNGVNNISVSDENNSGQMENDGVGSNEVEKGDSTDDSEKEITMKEDDESKEEEEESTDDSTGEDKDVISKF